MNRSICVTVGLAVIGLAAPPLGAQRLQDLAAPWATAPPLEHSGNPAEDRLKAASNTTTGLLVGAAVGLSAASLFLAAFCSDPDTRCEADEYARATLIIAVPPTLIGGLIGSLIPERR